MTRRATTDVIGKAGFGYEFKTLQILAERLTGSSNSITAGSTGNAGSGNTVGSAAVAEQCVDILKVSQGTTRLRLSSAFSQLTIWSCVCVEQSTG